MKKGEPIVQFGVRSRLRSGELTINWLVVAALALLALFVMGFIFSAQLSDFSKRLFGISNDIDAQRRGEQCANLFSGRQCYTQTCPSIQEQVRTGGDPTAQYLLVPAPNGTWADCPPPQYCCERIQ